MSKEFDTLGFYEPGFLHLRVNTDLDISDLNELMRNHKTQQYFSTFLHEYIHFLQDITTTSGLLAAHFYIDFIKAVNWTIRNDGKAEFKVPVQISNTNNVEANIKLREVYRGEASGSALIKYDRYSTEEVNIKDKNNKEYKPLKYNVHYYDLKTRAGRTLHFGYTCLKEYVAHAVQKNYLAKTDHADIPYQIAELIVKSEYPEFGDNPMFIVALCDASLMCFHPAQMFFNTLERMKADKFVPNSTKSIYEFAYKDLNFQGESGIETVESLFQKIVNQVDQQFSDALQSEPFQPNYKWLKHILTEAQNLRINNPNFMCELIEVENKLSDDFFKVFKALGTPFFTNKSEKGGFVPPENYQDLPLQPYQLLVFKQIINVYNGQQSCSMYDFCKTRPDMDITNELCKTSPWKRAKEPELCPFAQLWRTWGLTDDIPVKK